MDGKGYEAKLQHPLAVAWSGKQNQLFVCDTYNHKIKKIQVSNGNCVSIHKNSSWFAEPSGCCFNDSENILYVCDTNNNSIKTIDLTNYAVEKVSFL